MSSQKLITIGFGLFIPIVTGIFYYYRKKSDTIEVLWSNNLRQSCIYTHDEHIPMKNLCKIPFCAIYKIERIKNLILNAKYSIDIAMYMFTVNDIADSLIRVHKKGVKVRFITCRSQTNATGSCIWKLSKEGIPVRFRKIENSDLMHHKFCIIDGKRRIKNLQIYENLKCKTKPESLLINGSCNWTCQGFNLNWENIIIASNDILINSFEDEFEKIWISFRR